MDHKMIIAEPIRNEFGEISIQWYYGLVTSTTGVVMVSIQIDEQTAKARKRPQTLLGSLSLISLNFMVPPAKQPQDTP